MRTFRVKNFEKFQHYKDRSPPWIKLYNELLDDYEFGQLPDASKWHLIAIWLLASRSNNEIPYDADWISRRVNAISKVELSDLVSKGFILLNQIDNNNASVMLADSKQDAMPEGERESSLSSSLEDSLFSLEEKKEERSSGSGGSFEEFWALYPNKVGKSDARKKFELARKSVEFCELMVGLRRYLAKTDDRPWCNPATWLKQGRWEDQPAQANGGGNGTHRDSNGARPSGSGHRSFASYALARAREAREAKR